MTTWREFWDSAHSIYVSERHKDVHYRDVAEQLAAFVPHAQARVLDHGSGEAIHADLVAARAGELILCDAAATVRASVAARFAGNAKITVIAPEDVERGVTVASRQRRDYNPLGVRLGAFTLNGMVDAGPGFDSNLLGTKSNKTSDGFMDETASLSLDSDWSRHAVGVSGNMDSRQYFNNNIYNWVDCDVGGYGRYDLSSVSNAELRYRHYRDHLVLLRQWRI
jgi:hypothetical protein